MKKVWIRAKHYEPNIRNHTLRNVYSAKIQISLSIRDIQSEPLLAAFWIAKNAKFLHADNEHSDQIARMRSYFESSLGAHVRRYITSRCATTHIIEIKKDWIQIRVKAPKALR